MSQLPQNRKRYEPKKLQAVHHDILRLHLNGLKNYEIAEQVGVTPVTVSNILNSGLGRERLRYLQEIADEKALTVNEMLHETAQKSEDFLRQVARGDVETTTALRVRVCQDQLDRAGYSKVQRTVNLDMQGQLTAEDIEQIKREALGPNVVRADAEVIEGD